jgi:lipopolysaccharide biosynthesis regulator YciM
MLVLVPLGIILVVFCLFLWIAFANPVSIEEFHLLWKTFSVDLMDLMLASFVLGAMLIFIGWLARDIRRAIRGYLDGHQKSREKKKGQSLKEDLNKGMEAFFRGDLAKAKASLGEVLKRDPWQIELYFRLSEVALKEGNEEEALHWLERGSLVDIKNGEILLREAELLKQMNRFNEAIRTLNRAIRLDETNLKALRELREIYQESRKWEEAIQVQKTILKAIKGRQAEEEETLFLLGLKYGRAREFLERDGEGSLESALKEVKEIVREQKSFVPGFVLLGDIYLRMGRWASAGKVWGKSFRRFNSVIFLLRLEELYLGRGDPGTLLRIYQRALKNDPQNWVTAFFYAKLCLRLEILDEALEEIDEISLRQQDFPALHRLMAEIYLHKKDFGRAAQEFEKTFELSGTSYLPFSCSACERESKEWIAYCPECHRWGTYTVREGDKAGPGVATSASATASFSL